MKYIITHLNEIDADSVRSNAPIPRRDIISGDLHINNDVAIITQPIKGNLSSAFDSEKIVFSASLKNVTILEID